MVKIVKRADNWIILLMLMLAAATAWSQIPQKKRVAVFDFDNAAVQGGISIPFAQSTPPNVGKAAADLLITKLVQDGNMTVIERDAIDKLLAEQNLTNSDRTDPTTAAKLGRILGVDAIIMGTITHFDYMDKTTGGGTRFGGFGGASMKTKHDIVAKVLISTRLVSPDTGEVLAVSEGAGEVDRKGVKIDIRDASRINVMGAQANNPVMNECMDKAIAQLATQLEQQLPKLPPRSPVIDGLVADASDSGQLVLNVGRQHGVRVGDHLQVWRAGREIKDPVTGKVLMRDDTLLGEAIVVTVNDISSVAHYTGKEPPKVLDIVKSMPKSQ
jgi:curli biogenesis system outer membrane secretion channel CsgG